MTKKTIAEYDLGSYESVVEFSIETEGDDLFFKLNTGIDYYLGGENYNELAKTILLEYNKLDRFLIENNQDQSKLKIKVIIEEVDEEE